MRGLYSSNSHFDPRCKIFFEYVQGLACGRIKKPISELQQKMKNAMMKNWVFILIKCGQSLT